MSKNMVLALLTGLALAAGNAQAASAPITWAAPMNETGKASDVITHGTLVAAVTSGMSTTLNGVAFVGGAVAKNKLFGSGTVDFGSGVTFTRAYAGNYNWANAPSTWSSNYQTLVNSGTSGLVANRATLTVSGLTVGATYQIQIFQAVSTGNIYGPWPTAFAAGGKTSAEASNATPQYITGTFTANDTTEAISLSGPNNYALFAAVQVRKVPDGIAAASEPGTHALMGAGMLAFGFPGWRRRPAA